MSKFDWDKVSKANPCKICGATKGCLLAKNGSAALCHHVPSDNRTRSGLYRHQLKTVPRNEIPDGWRRQQTKLSAGGVFSGERFYALSGDDEQARLCAYLAERLGVLPRALESLDVRWDATKKAAAFPMKAPNGIITGVSYRHVKSGQKFNAEGSVDGLFLPLDLNLFAAQLIVCEGASDTAAALSLGYCNVVGRSSCRTGATLIDELCRRRRIRQVLIVADRDNPIEDGDEGVGMLGAEALRETLTGIEVGIIQPPVGIKDLRQWLSVDWNAACGALSPQPPTVTGTDSFSL